MTPPQRRPAPAWTIIIPVKDTSVAKTRLSHLDQPARASLALAFALDAAGAALGCPLVRRVLAVTNDEVAARALGFAGVEVVADLLDAGQNSALEHGFGVVRQGDARAPVAAMSGDLPALRAADLTLALTLADGLPRWFVADAEGVGTTLLGAGPGVSLSPRFGGRSRERHSRLGAVEIRSDRLDRLRRDVDIEADLRDALLLGVGPNTRAALSRLDAPCDTAK